MVIEYASDLYPERLRYIQKPPSRLYVNGNPEILNEIGIAVIGSRTNTQYGERMCIKFVKDLVKYNINIISGLAYGIDSIAHKTCLKNSGKTIAVLPSGLKNIYPEEHVELVKAIIENGGAVVSEYEDGVEAEYKNFLERNRIVAGLGIGTLVVEGGARSGTSVTARFTQEQGKEVFCIPSSLENIKGKGTNELIQNGAKLITNVEDILEYYSDITFNRNEVTSNDIILDIPQDLRMVYKTINNIPRDINEIAHRTGLSISEINYKTMLLQLDGKILELPGQRFIRNTEERRMNTRRFGIIGEKIAKGFLCKNGYEIIQNNFYTKRGEIDIIAKKDNYIVFVEVKSRSNLKYGTPAMAVNFTKMKHIKYAAKVFLTLNRFKEYMVRFDVIEILIKNGKCEVNHIKDIM